MRTADTSSARDDGPRGAASRSTFGPYLLLRKLASGGMGEIFLAQRLGLEGFIRPVVIKRVLGHHLDKADYLDMFLSEAKLVARLDHPNIIQIHEVGEIEGDHYLAMEYVRGKTLRDVIDALVAAGRSMPVAHAVELAIRLCEGLGYAHEARDGEGRPMQVVHRDINPHNVLISYAGELKLIDFGIAKSELASAHTATGTIKGKFIYMSPEQSAAEPLDRRSDLFCLGIVLYEMLTLANPFLRPNIVLSLEAIQRQPVLPISTQRPDAAALDRVLARALEKSPEDRFSTAFEMRDALRDLSLNRAVVPPEENLSSFLQSLFADDLVREQQLFAEADRAVRALQDPLPPAGHAAASDTDELLVAAPVVGPSPFLDEEPTVAGDPDDLALRSLEVSQPLRALPRSAEAPTSPFEPPVQAPRPTLHPTRADRVRPPRPRPDSASPTRPCGLTAAEGLALAPAGRGATSSAVAAMGVVGTGPGASFSAFRPEDAGASGSGLAPSRPASPPRRAVFGGPRLVVLGLVCLLTTAAAFLLTRSSTPIPPMAPAAAAGEPLTVRAVARPRPSEPSARPSAAGEREVIGPGGEALDPRPSIDLLDR